MLRMDVAQLEALIDEHFPQVKGHSHITRLSDEMLELHMPFRSDMLRPGGTISGPALMSLADLGAYYLILARLGPVVLAVTSSLTIHFLRKPDAGDVRAEVRLLKLGRQLAVCEAHLWSVTSGHLVAQATVTYALPTSASDNAV